MIHTNKTILSLSTALLLCSVTLVLAAPPDGKGKPPKGNQPVTATANFSSGDINSNGSLGGEFIDNGDFDTLEGQLADGETIEVGGDAGAGLAALDSEHSILPAGAVTSCAGTTCLVMFSDVTWTIRLDRDKEPTNRVQFKMRWVNVEGLERHLRIGWVVQAYEDEIYPLPDSDYGISSSSSLESAMITFSSDLFRIDGDVEVAGKGKKKKTELEVFSSYGETFETALWCNMGTTGVCRASTVIETALPLN